MGLVDTPEFPECLAVGQSMTMDRASCLLSSVPALPCNSQMWHWLHIQVTLRTGSDGATEVLLDSKERKGQSRREPMPLRGNWPHSRHP